MKNHCIDFFKGIACLMIILIHCRFPGVFGQIVLVLARPAVFYFFMVSGYYSYYDSEEKFKARMLLKIVRLCKMIGVTLGLYFVWECILRQFGSSGNLKNFLFQELFTVDNFFKVLLFQSDVLVGPFWFLLSLFWCYVALLLLGKKKVKYCILLIPLMLILNIIFSEIFTLLGKSVDIYYYRNFWLTGFPFYLLGYMIHEKELDFKQYLSRKKGWFMTGLGMLVSLAEFYFVGNSLIYIGNIFSVMGVLIVSIYDIEQRESWLTKLGNKFSMYIYCVHWFIIDVLAILVKHMKISDYTWYQYLLPFISIVLSIIGAMVINFIREFMGGVRDKK